MRSTRAGDSPPKSRRDTPDSKALPSPHRADSTLPHTLFARPVGSSFVTFPAIAQMIASGEVQAGIGILETVGDRESDALDNLLAEHKLYINRCKIIEDHHREKNVVEFSSHLAVTEKHNRLKICFVCPHISGMLGSILSMISDYDINLTEIHSIPCREEIRGSYRFFAELELNLLEQEAQALIYQLSCETQDLKLLGSYSCEE